MTLFVLKKIVTPFFYPLSIISLLLFCGIVCNLRRRQRRIGLIFITSGIIFLFLSAFEPITDHLVAKLETRYPPLSEMALQNLSQVKYICVLGAGTNPDPERPFNGQLSRTSQARLIEGVRIFRHLPASKIILSGGAVFTDPPEGQVMAAVARMLAVPPGKIIIEGESKDTSDQARIIKSIVKDEPTVVVTSAIHMPRSMMLFHRAGIQAIAAPTDYLTAKSSPNPIKRLFPSPDSLLNMHAAVHELLGIAWIKIFH